MMRHHPRSTLFPYTTLFRSLLKIATGIGFFVDKVWVTEAIRPGIVACSHHLGRWRLSESSGGERWSTALVDLQRLRSEEHTSELQSQSNLVCRLLLEKKKRE